MHPKRKTIGLRVPDNRIALSLLEALGEPLMSSSLLLPGQTLPLSDPEDIRDALDNQLELIIDGGNCGFEPTTVVDLTGPVRSEEHTSELQSRGHLVCRLLLDIT